MDAASELKLRVVHHGDQETRLDNAVVFQTFLYNYNWSIG